VAGFVSATGFAFAAEARNFVELLPLALAWLCWVISD